MNLGLDIFDGIAGLDFKGDGLSSECLDEDLHATTQTKHQDVGMSNLLCMCRAAHKLLHVYIHTHLAPFIWSENMGLCFLLIDTILECVHV